MTGGKKRTTEHLVDQQGEALFKANLPVHWIVREYRPDYGLDFTIELFKAGKVQEGKSATFETLGEHVFVQLKSTETEAPKTMPIYSRSNVEKSSETLSNAEQVAKIDAYRLRIETSELVTVERMGIAVPVLLVVSDLSVQRCSFICLNDYIDKILVPEREDYRTAHRRSVYVPVRNEIGSYSGQVALRWYAKRPKLLAAFQRFTYQYSELRQAQQERFFTLATYFAHRILEYDFWDDTEMCPQISSLATELRQFVDAVSPNPVDASPAYHQMGDVLELWSKLAALPKYYEDVWREWFLPTALGELTSTP